MEALRLKINKQLPQDIKIFCLQPIAQRFNPKNCASHREYSYFLPTFMLTPVTEVCLERPPEFYEKQEAEKKAAKEAAADKEETK